MASGMDCKTRLFYIVLRLLRKGAIRRYTTDPEGVQRRVLRYLVRRSARTEWGRRYGYAGMKSYEDFARAVPVSTYEELKGDIERMRQGGRSILWPGLVRWYAKSSGTTSDKSKFIPVSRRGLWMLHYRGGMDNVYFYLRQNPSSRLMHGKAMILGGSHAPNYNTANSFVGDVSAVMMENLPGFINASRVPSKEIALMADFAQKREAMARTISKEDVTNISGVPSWMLSVLTRMMEVTGREYLDDIWPNLEVFFHGGVAFTPYREQYRRLFRGAGIQYRETYNASEGFFGVQDDPSDSSMLLMIDYDCFYEFIPMSEFGRADAHPVPLWKVATGVDYAVLISTSCGLWRYIIGDTVRFTSVKPYKFVITGRTKHFINAFGEELIVDNAEKGIAAACEATGAVVRDYTAAPVFMDSSARCRHQWLVEFAVQPASAEEFAIRLDEALQHINSDYEAKRRDDITLQRLELVVAREGLFEEWMASRGKLGGQNKVPRLSNSRGFIEPLLELNSRI